MDKLRFVVDNNVLVSSILIASSPQNAKARTGGGRRQEKMNQVQGMGVK